MKKTVPDVSWEGEEYIQYKHNVGWYVALVIVGVALSALSVWLKWWSFLGLVVVCIMAILVCSARPPRKIKYTLNKDGLLEGEKLHKYTDFRAFGILKEDAHFSAVLIPKKRFGLQVKVYFPSTDGEAIVDALGARLPMEEVKLDFLDKMVNFLRI